MLVSIYGHVIFLVSESFHLGSNMVMWGTSFYVSQTELLQVYVLLQLAPVMHRWLHHPSPLERSRSTNAYVCL